MTGRGMAASPVMVGIVVAKSEKGDGAASEVHAGGGGRNACDDATGGRKIAGDGRRGGRARCRRVRCGGGGAGIGWRVGLKTGAGDARIREDKGKDGSVSGDGVEDEMEAVGEQSLHHPPAAQIQNSRICPRSSTSMRGGLIRPSLSSCLLDRVTNQLPA
jgi:hypothetical protein